MSETMQRVYEYLATHGVEFGINLVAAILIFVIGRWLAKLVSRVIEKLMLRSKVDKTLCGFVRHLSFFLLLIVVIIAALEKLGVETTSAIAILGAAGLAVGFALQGSLANFAAGILMIIFKPFNVGELVEIGGKLGVVEEIEILTTSIISPDNIRIIVPNSQVTGGSIMNYSATGKRRVDLVVGVSYEDDLKKASEVIRRVLAEDARVLKEPAATVAVSELGDSSVNFVVRPWVKVEDYWGVYFDITEKVKLALDANGITIPFPQTDVHIKDGELKKA